MIGRRSAESLRVRCEREGIPQPLDFASIPDLAARDDSRQPSIPLPCALLPWSSSSCHFDVRGAVDWRRWASTDLVDAIRQWPPIDTLCQLPGGRGKAQEQPCFEPCSTKRVRG
jgi:hypothetical protein